MKADQVDAGQISTWWFLAFGVWNAGLSLVLWLRRPGEDAGKAVAALDQRLIQVETHLKHMPTSGELAELEGTVRQIDERTEGLAEAINQIRASQGRIEAFLLNSK